MVTPGCPTRNTRKELQAHEVFCASQSQQLRAQRLEIASLKREVLRLKGDVAPKVAANDLLKPGSRIAARMAREHRREMAVSPEVVPHAARLSDLGARPRSVLENPERRRRRSVSGAIEGASGSLLKRARYGSAGVFVYSSTPRKAVRCPRSLVDAFHLDPLELSKMGSDATLFCDVVLEYFNCPKSAVSGIRMDVLGTAKLAIASPTTLRCTVTKGCPTLSKLCYLRSHEKFCASQGKTLGNEASTRRKVEKENGELKKEIKKLKARGAKASLAAREAAETAAIQAAKASLPRKLRPRASALEVDEIEEDGPLSKKAKLGKGKAQN
ncbi:hypothetical protein JCM11641_005893 [Rhodosporidiobolus odoratus]